MRPDPWGRVLMRLLSALEAVEVFLEMAVAGLLGSRQRWRLVWGYEAVLPSPPRTPQRLLMWPRHAQVRAVLRSLLLFEHGMSLLPNPPIEVKPRPRGARLASRLMQTCAQPLERAAVACDGCAPGGQCAHLARAPTRSRSCGAVLMAYGCPGCDAAAAATAGPPGDSIVEPCDPHACAGCGCAIRASTMLEDVPPPPTVGRRSGRVLATRVTFRRPATPDPAAADCAECAGRARRRAQAARARAALADPAASTLTPERLLAEAMYTARPFVFLLVGSRCGRRSWGAWFAALAMELGSLGLLRDPPGLIEGERSELGRRKLLLLLYALRAPFYTRFLASAVGRWLQWFRRRIPALGLAVDAGEDYIAMWHRLYSYSWSI